jgi:hypothetical protein
MIKKILKTLDYQEVTFHQITYYTIFSIIGLTDLLFYIDTTFTFSILDLQLFILTQ